MTTAYQRAREKYYGLPVPAHLKHGQNSRACRIYGCDCKACLPSGRRVIRGRRMSGAERQRKLRQAKKGKPVPPTVKHGVYASRVYGCPCDICRAARNRVLKRQRAKRHWKTTAVGIWTTVFDTTTIHWPPVGQGTWTCPDCYQQFPHRRQTQSAASPPKEATLAA